MINEEEEENLGDLLNQLENLGIGQTNIAQSEIDKIKQLLPNCKILLQ